MLHDPETYPEPLVFKPERFANLSVQESTAKDPRNFVFGFGRRICVGALFADNALFIMLASILACFNIRRKITDGREVIPEVEYKQYIGRPTPVQCNVVLRSRTASALINVIVETEA
jgi:cytochrome P450